MGSEWVNKSEEGERWILETGSEIVVVEGGRWIKRINRIVVEYLGKKLLSGAGFSFMAWLLAKQCGRRLSPNMGVIFLLLLQVWVFLMRRDYIFWRKRNPEFRDSILKIQVFSFSYGSACCYCCCCWVASVVSDSVWPHRRQPTRLPRLWDSPGKNTGVGCHFLLQCMKVKVKLLSRVRLFATPWTVLPGSSVRGIFQARVLEWGAIAFSDRSA